MRNRICEVRRVPALFYLSFLSTGIIFGKFIYVKIVFLFYILLILSIILLFLYLFLRRDSLFIIDFLLLLLLLIASFLTFYVREHFPITEDLSFQTKEHSGVLIQNPIKAGKKRVFNIRLLDEKNECFLPYIAKIYTEELEKDIGYGDVIRFKGALKIPSSARNPGSFNFRNYLKRKGIYFISYINGKDIVLIGHLRGNPFYSKIICPVKKYSTRIMSRNLDEIHGTLLQGLTLGLKENIPREIKDIFSNAGVIHILAVSGLHIGIISFFLFILFRSLHIPFNLSIILSCLLLVVYAFLTGLRPPVVRSTIMFIFIMLGMLSQRRIVLLNIIAVSAILILILNPLDLFDTGFQLSYAATFSIVILYPRIYNCFPKVWKKVKILKNFVILPLSVSLSAQLGVAPIVAFYFFKFPLAASIANIIIVPIVSLVIPIGFLTVLGSIIHPFIPKILAGANWLLLHIILKTSIFFSSFPHLLLWVRRPPFLFFLLYYPFLFIFFLLSGRKRFKFFVYASLICMNIFIFSRVWKVYRPKLAINFLGVSEGDASVIEFPNNEVCLVDGGRRSDYVDYGERVLAPFLRSKGIKKLNTVIATHPDVDHYGGLITVLENFKVDKLLLNGSSKITYLYKKMLDTAKLRGVLIYNIHRGETVWLGDYPLYVLNPPVLKELDLPSNEGSIVFKFGYGDVTFLFTGDFSNRILKLPAGLLPSTVLKFPHHGARFGDERAFLGTVHPEVTTISVGKNNRYGHPAKENIAILDSLKSKVYRTDESGAIILNTDGENIIMETMVR